MREEEALEALRKFNSMFPTVASYHEKISRMLREKNGWGVDIQVGDIVECAALPVENHGYFIVIDKHDGKVKVVHARSRRPVANNAMEAIYHFRKVDAVSALGALDV